MHTRESRYNLRPQVLTDAINRTWPFAPLVGPNSDEWNRLFADSGFDLSCVNAAVGRPPQIKRLFQLGVFGLGLFEDGEIGVCLFP